MSERSATCYYLNPETNYIAQIIIDIKNVEKTLRMIESKTGIVSADIIDILASLISDNTVFNVSGNKAVYTIGINDFENKPLCIPCESSRLGIVTRCSGSACLQFDKALQRMGLSDDSVQKVMDYHQAQIKNGQVKLLAEWLDSESIPDNLFIDLETGNLVYMQIFCPDIPVDSLVPYLEYRKAKENGTIDKLKPDKADTISRIIENAVDTYQKVEVQQLGFDYKFIYTAGCYINQEKKQRTISFLIPKYYEFVQTVREKTEMEINIEDLKDYLFEETLRNPLYKSELANQMYYQLGLKNSITGEALAIGFVRLTSVNKSGLINTEYRYEKIYDFCELPEEVQNELNYVEQFEN